MKSRELVNLMLSPQWTSKLLHHFICGAMQINHLGIKTELLYLMLPLLTDDITRKKIKTNINSTFFTTFVKNNAIKGEDLLEFKKALLCKNDQIKEYKKFTNRALIYLGNVFKISIGKYTYIETVLPQTELEFFSKHVSRSTWRKTKWQKNEKITHQKKKLLF